MPYEAVSMLKSRTPPHAELKLDPPVPYLTVLSMLLMISSEYLAAD